MATRSSLAATSTAYSEFVNPQWVALLDLLGMNVEYTRCMGTELFTSDGRRILDFLSGYCVHNTGHNHPRIVQALKEELDRSGPAMLQSHVPELAGELAEKLCTLAGGALKKVFFCSSGSEGVEAAIKFARAKTGRSTLVCAKGSFHGLTAGALSLMSDPFWREGFGPLLQDIASVPFSDLSALEQALASKKAACFIVEPIQAEAGIILPPADYLKDAAALCRKYGTLFVLDEVQTGMFRTGKFLAAQQFGVSPDMVILAKALSGGLVPVGAVLMTDEIYSAIYSSLKRSIVHTSTFSENSLSMRAGLAALEVLETESLGPRSAGLGEEFRAGLREALAPYEMVKEVRGLGMMTGIEFTAPRRTVLKMSFQAFQAIHAAMFGQMIVMRMFRDHNLLTQICGNNFMVLKAAPPLLVTREQLREFTSAIREVAEFMHSSTAFWSDALSLARRAVHI